MAMPPSMPSGEPKEAPGAPSSSNPQMQQIMSTLSPEEQQIVIQVMSNANLLNAIDKITEILAPEIVSQGSAMGSPDQAMFGPPVA